MLIPGLVKSKWPGPSSNLDAKSMDWEVEEVLQLRSDSALSHGGIVPVHIRLPREAHPLAIEEGTASWPPRSLAP